MAFSIAANAIRHLLYSPSSPINKSLIIVGVINTHTLFYLLLKYGGKYTEISDYCGLNRLYIICDIYVAPYPGR